MPAHKKWVEKHKNFKATNPMKIGYNHPDVVYNLAIVYICWTALNMKGLKTTQRDKNKQFYILHNDSYLYLYTYIYNIYTLRRFTK